MDRLLYVVALGLAKLLQTLPLRLVARIGRTAGGLFYWLDSRHRQVALRNLTRCFGPEKTPAEIRALAKENFRRIGENFCCAVKTAVMTDAELVPHLEVAHFSRIPPVAPGGAPQSRIVAIGHFGNFELYSRANRLFPTLRCATTYRALRQPALDRLLRSLRERSGCLVFERRRDGAALKTALREKSLALGLLADQHAGRAGLALPFFGHECSTSDAPAILALRYGCPLNTGFCFRVALARWRIEAGEEIPTHAGGRPRPVAAITLDINRAFEAAVRRDPANWFWVHNRWKSKGREPKGEGPEPAGTSATANVV